MGENYLANWVQSLFYALGDEVVNKTLALGGDGRYFGKEAAQIIIKLAAGNGFKRIVVGKDALLATPTMSALIRRRKLYGEKDAKSTETVPLMILCRCEQAVKGCLN
jgi:phosphoglucomutase